MNSSFKVILVVDKVEIGTSIEKKEGGFWDNPESLLPFLC
jgi:hypothetical protein